MKEIKWFGSAGHFICSDKCQFHLTTQVGRYLISTVGELCFDNNKGELKSLGIDGRLFETMVFEITSFCECGCGLPRHNGSEIEMLGYFSRKEANENHERLVEKYRKIK